MGIGLRRARRIEVDDVVDARHVEPTCGNIGGDQNVEAPLPETAHRAISLALGHVALKGDCSQTILRKLKSKPFSSMLGPRENDRCSAIIFSKQSIQKIALSTFGDRIERMFDSLSGSDRIKLDDMGSIENAARQVPNRSRHRRREQEVLSVFGQSRKNPFDVGQKTHVEHVIGFIEDEGLDFGKIQLSLLQQIEHPPRATNHDLRTPTKRSNLRTGRDPAEDGDSLDLGELREQFYFGIDLDGQLTSRRQNEGERAFPGLLDQSLQNGQREGGRLSGSRLGQAHDVSSFETRRDRIGLNRSRFFKARCLQAVDQKGIKFKAVESALRNA